MDEGNPPNTLLFTYGNLTSIESEKKEESFDNKSESEIVKMDTPNNTEIE